MSKKEKKEQIVEEVKVEKPEKKVEDEKVVKVEKKPEPPKGAPKGPRPGGMGVH